jgi:uncharacterized protein (DUF433 family)
MKFDRITSDSAPLGGQPGIRVLRLPVNRVHAALAAYPGRDDLSREYPDLEDEEIRQVLAFAAAAVDDRIIDLPRSRGGEHGLA